MRPALSALSARPAAEESLDEFAAIAVPRLRRLAYACCRDWHRADDAVQGSLERVFGAWSRVRAADAYGCSRTALVRLLVSEGHRARRHHEVTTDDVSQHEQLHPGSPPGSSSPHGTPEEADLLALLADLTPGQRAVVVLRCAEGLSVAETARTLACREDAVNSQAHAARQSLRALLTDPSERGPALDERQHPAGVEHDVVDLDLEDDPHVRAQDRVLDARLALLVTDRLQALELPPTRVDLGVVRSRALAARSRRRKRTARLVGAAAGAAVVVAAVGTGLLPLPGSSRSTPTASTGGDTGPVPLRTGVPDLPAGEVAALTALEPPAVPRGTEWPLPYPAVTTPVDCDRAELDLGVRPAVLDGLDGSRTRQQCAVLDTGGGTLGRDRWLYRFYLPPGVDLSREDPSDATAQGVSWTQVAVDQRAEAITPEDRPHEQSGGVTTIRWGTWEDGLASVHRTGPSSTDLAWVEPHGRSGPNSDDDGLAVRAVVAAAPVTAVRAALGSDLS